MKSWANDSKSVRHYQGEELVNGYGLRLKQQITNNRLWIVFLQTSDASSFSPSNKPSV